MGARLTAEERAALLKVGISEFADAGFEKASIRKIAGRAGISSGVLYKYYRDKEDFFSACLDSCLASIESLLDTFISESEPLLVNASALIEAMQSYSRSHTDELRLYLRIIADGGLKDSAAKLESMTASLYTDFIRRAQEQKLIREDADPAYFAFFFDNLLMMLHFSYSSPYLEDRFRLFCGPEAAADDRKCRDQLLLFLESAFTFASADVKHKGG